ncbi:MAG: hypothetical protein OXC95_14440 [Dehalococcoidia bacterium]|nr:hypothetical protein [Dehalococcoidia bacterium]
MKKIKFWQFAVIIVVGFTVGATGTHLFINNPSEEVGSNLSVSVAEADFRLPEFEGDMFTPQKAVYDGDKLVLTLRSNVLYPETLEEVTLTEGAEHGTVKFDYTTDGDFNVIVTNPPGDIDNASLDLPAVSFYQYASISVDPTAETFIGPRDATYRITDRDSNSDSGTQRFRIEYEPDDPASPRITGAKIQAGEVEVYAIRAGGKFDSANRFIFGRLVFPIEAEELMERDGVELVITRYSEIVRDSVAMPVGLVSEGTGSSGDPKGPGSGSPNGPTGNTEN